MASQQLKYTLTHYRKPEHTHEAFVKWIVEEHLPLAIPIFKKHGVLGYSLFVTPSSINGAVKEEMRKLGPTYATWDFADFDCLIEYTLANLQVINNVVSDPDWAIAIAHQDEWWTRLELSSL
ncbi:hypothetical protein HD806DRAFT_270232 [Xylariaceae sp. AK1471]|nr:hypothetical protein HD806DRAFT_270232 [Xylariaceae sp. AK1471]